MKEFVILRPVLCDGETLCKIIGTYNAKSRPDALMRMKYIDKVKAIPGNYYVLPIKDFKIHVLL